ncbi:MAG: helix-turn-helix transcriptional regulator [Agathobacter sp.]|nr:helix-turn-helix transcriptional regulator [Agathobacter sp.]
MATQDYVINSEHGDTLVEVEKRKFARSIVDELIIERKRLGLTQQDIADRTGMKAPNVTRIESCKFTPTLDVLERYAKAVGKNIKFELVDIE